MEGIAAGAVTHRDAKSGRVAAMRWRWRLMNCALAETGRKTGRATARVTERKTHKQRDTRATHTHGGRGEGRISGHAAARARVDPTPIHHGGGDEAIRRAGTESVRLLCVWVRARPPARRIWISPSLFLLSFIRFVFLSFSIASFCLFLFCCCCCCCYYYCWFLLLWLIF